MVMSAPRIPLLALPLLLLAACGPLEEDAYEAAAGAEDLPRVLSGVAEPTPPGAEDDQERALAEQPGVERAREPKLPSPNEEWLLPAEEDPQANIDGGGDGRAPGDEAP